MRYLYIYLYTYYIHPELKNGDYRSSSGNGSSAALEEGSKGEHRGITMKQCRGVAGESLEQLSRSHLLELPSLLYAA